MLTQVRLKELLHYDPETGKWTWLVTRGAAHIGDVVSCKDARGYIQFNVEGKLRKAARLAWFYMTGEWPPDEIDHKDRNRLNNRWDNLRLATHSQNMANRNVSSNNLIGIKGVMAVRSMKSKPFRARVLIDGKSKHLGYFATSELANAAYMKAASEYHGEFAYDGRSQISNMAPE
jgi:hypothetical protein